MSKFTTISIHALRVEGDDINPMWRIRELTISIHALRVEGDFRCKAVRGRLQNFYPRPPGGGRRCAQWNDVCEYEFLSTPSGWRATAVSSRRAPQSSAFLSTPSGWRATGSQGRRGRKAEISIHALRVEGDYFRYIDLPETQISIHALRVEGDYYPVGKPTFFSGISIHALRVEGDIDSVEFVNNVTCISIHALRVEGD